LNRKAATPATDKLFLTNEFAEKIDDERAQAFLTTVAKGLFMCKRARPDIMTTIAFLCTRVRDPDKDDWAKLLCMLRYLQGSRELYVTLRAEESNVIKWYGDASFAVHDNMKSHTGGSLTLGAGGISMEAELVAADDLSNSIIWTNYFLEAQGYKTKETVLFQDNKSCILLHSNGKASSSKRSRHLNIHYYFLSDRIANGELRVEFCLKDNMIADYFTKPLQGAKFREFRRIIMNLKDEKD